jgi:hypothetical protein
MYKLHEKRTIIKRDTHTSEKQKEMHSFFLLIVVAVQEPQEKKNNARKVQEKKTTTTDRCKQMKQNTKTILYVMC